MNPKLIYGKRHNYTHMIQVEKDIWEQFMDRFPDRFDAVIYDQRVGEGAGEIEGLEENYQSMANDLSRLRIDVIGFKNNDVTIIEIKERATAAAVGQLQAYKILFEKDYKEYLVRETILVCKTISKDVEYVCDINRIYVVVV